MADDLGGVDFHQKRHSHAGNSSAILRSARRMLGVSRGDVRRALESKEWGISMYRYRVVECDSTGWRTSASEWWALCQCLYLDCDSLSYGYSAQRHLMRIRGAIRSGEFLFPVSAELKARLDSLEELERAERESFMFGQGLTFVLGSRWGGHPLLRVD